MTMKHIEFHDSAVMRELERQAIRKGHFDSSPEDTVRLAVEAKKSQKTIVATDNVFQDLLILASNLRERGYEDQARDLESKVAAYKTAETHLYHVHDEEGEDVLNFAHPEGSVQMDDRGSPFGKVFSPTEKAKVIRDVVQQEPTGKLAVVAALLKKKAAHTVEEINALISKLWTSLNTDVRTLNDITFSQDTATDGLPHYEFSKQRVLSYPEAYLNYLAELSVAPVSDIEAYKRAKATGTATPEQEKQMDQVIARGNSALSTKARTIFAPAFQWRFDSIPQLSSISDTKAYNDTLQVLEKTEQGLSKILQNPNSGTLGDIRRFMNAFNTDTRGVLVQLGGMLKDVRTAKNSLLEANPQGIESGAAPEWWSPQVTSTRYQQAADAWEAYAKELPGDDPARAKALEWRNMSLQMAEAIKRHGDQSFNVLYHYTKGLVPVGDTYYNLDQHSMAWLDLARTKAGLKQASEDKVYEISKFAQGLDLGEAQNIKAIRPLTKAPPPKPEMGPAQTPAAKPAPATPAAAPTTPATAPQAAGRPTPEERQQVGLLQNVLADFAKAVSNPNEKTQLAAKLSSAKAGVQTTDADLQQWAGVMTDTGGKKTFDGKWGPLTRSGLDAVNVVINRARTAGLYSGDSVEIDGDWTKDPPQELIQRAQKNTKVIAALMSALQLGKYVSQAVQEATGQQSSTAENLLDQIPENISRTTVDPRKKGTIPVDLQSLKTLFDFYNFLSGNLNLTITASGEKQGIVVLAQAIRPAGEMTVPTLQPPEKDLGAMRQLTAGQFLFALKWFYTRAQQTYATLVAEKARPEYVTKARQYLDAITNLVNQWNRDSRQFTGLDSVVDPSRLTGSGVTGSGLGAAYPKSEKPGTHPGKSTPQGSGGVSMPGPERSSQDDMLEAVSNPPLGDFINIADLTQNWGVPDSENYSNMLANPWLDLRQLRGAYVGRLYNRLLSEYGMQVYDQLARQSGTDPVAYLATLFNKMSKDLNAVYSAWAQQIAPLENNPRVANIVRDQSKKLDQWMQTLSWLASSAVTSARARALRGR